MPTSERVRTSFCAHFWAQGSQSMKDIPGGKARTLSQKRKERNLKASALLDKMFSPLSSEPIV